MRHVLVVVSLVLAASRTVPASEWRTYGGSLRRLFFNTAETTITPDNVGQLRVKWQFPTGAIVTAQPAVAELALPGAGRTQVAFIASWDGYLYALRTRDGTQLWRFRMDEQPGAPYPFAASVHVQHMGGPERLFAAGGETVYCLDARTGAEFWRFDAGTRCAVSGLCGFRTERNQVESSPIVARDARGRPVVLFGMDVNDSDAGKGGFYAIDARDGRLVWFFDLESGSTCRPFPDDNIRRFDGYHTEAELGLPPGFLATRPGCGFDRTRTGCGNVFSSASVDEKRHILYFASANCDTDSDPATRKPPPPMPPYDEAIVALHLDGTPAWRWRPREVDPSDLDFGAVPNLFTIDFGGARRDVVGEGGKDGTYYVIDRDGVNEVTGVHWNDPDPSGLPYWRRQVVPGGEAGGLVGSASVDECEGRIYFATAPGTDEDIFHPQQPTVHALDMHTGAIVWENTTEPNADASFAPSMAIPGVVFEGKDVGGVLRAYAADTGTLLGQFPVSFTLPSAPAVVDGLVILGGGSGERGGDADSVSRIPQPVTALCVPGTPACDGRAPRGVRRHGFGQPSRCPRGPQRPGRQR